MEESNRTWEQTSRDQDSEWQKLAAQGHEAPHHGQKEEIHVFLWWHFPSPTVSWDLLCLILTNYTVLFEVSKIFSARPCKRKGWLQSVRRYLLLIWKQFHTWSEPKGREAIWKQFQEQVVSTALPRQMGDILRGISFSLRAYGASLYQVSLDPRPNYIIKKLQVLIKSGDSCRANKKMKFYPRLCLYLSLNNFTKFPADQRSV